MWWVSREWFVRRDGRCLFISANQAVCRVCYVLTWQQGGFVRCTWRMSLPATFWNTLLPVLCSSNLYCCWLAAAVAAAVLCVE